MSEAILTDVERLAALADADRTFLMTEEAFRLFYEWTARPVWLYLARMSGDDRLADDLLQETYYRFLRADAAFENDDHRRNYLFRIATNLVRDHRRRARPAATVLDGADHLPDATGATAEQVARRIDLGRALHRLKPRERSLLWLAYAQGFSHEEIAATLGLKTASLKALLFRARRRLLTVMTTGGRGGRKSS
jgi:RNA polymerase sigma-70 factor (ECF subfamily)